MKEMKNKLLEFSTLENHLRTFIKIKKNII